MQLNILNEQDANDPQGANNPFGLTMAAGVQFNLLSNGQPVASAVTDASGNLVFSVDDSWTNLSLTVDINTYDQVAQAMGQAIQPYIPNAPAYSTGVNFATDDSVIVNTPFGNWVSSPDGSNTVSYAISFFSITGESPLGPWSPQIEILEWACPVLDGIPVCTDDIPQTQGVGRNIYRMFTIGNVPQAPVLVGRIMNNVDSEFQDLMP